MSRDVNAVIRHLLALTGADPRKARLPLGKRKVRVHTQRIGDVRLIIVTPLRDPLPEVEIPVLNDVCAPPAWVLGGCPRDVFDPPEQWGLTGKRIYVPRGVVIPHWAGDALWALKVRRFVGDAPATADNGGKYGGARGGQITLYGAERLQGQRPLFIVEAELDALLLWQAAGDLVDVVALAGAGRTLPAQCLARLLPYTRIFAALDADKAGRLNATRLAVLSARVTPVRVPEGNDVTEYHQAGGDVRAWVMMVMGDDWHLIGPIHLHDVLRGIKALT